MFACSSIIVRFSATVVFRKRFILNMLLLTSMVCRVAISWAMLFLSSVSDC